ncbi:WhiB family transcriptional regulator [Frankia sp. AgB32]
MEHTDAGVHTVLADVERPAEHDPFGDHSERVLTERPTQATPESSLSATTVPSARTAPPDRVTVAPPAVRPRPVGVDMLARPDVPAAEDHTFGGVDDRMIGAQRGDGPATADPTRHGLAHDGLAHDEPAVHESTHEDRAYDVVRDDVVRDDVVRDDVVRDDVTGAELAGDDPGLDDLAGDLDPDVEGDTLASVIDLGLGDLFGEVMEWQERALCAQTDPEAFFPEKGGSTREAKRICSGCEVRPECLEYALENDERFGIWGGMSERERRKQRRRAV